MIKGVQVVRCCAVLSAGESSRGAGVAPVVESGKPQGDCGWHRCKVSPGQANGCDPAALLGVALYETFPVSVCLIGCFVFRVRDPLAGDRLDLQLPVGNGSKGTGRVPEALVLHVVQLSAVCACRGEPCREAIAGLREGIRDPARSFGSIGRGLTNAGAGQGDPG